ncbi:hypothetical protein [Nocardia pseudobrasiliensis]|uniref:Uncharacterized protein n=1 Tax=Nocardia pseudobrasiliensis TaxID=45979 RepID=A0A370HWK8_9NOCA|nr:hypothetical protein [Nocardia pseudobrasiliensis]RDI62897.1 hypothetical protein DFR76_112215 [Nocardia pseudobrasiliensis]
MSVTDTGIVKSASSTGGLPPLELTEKQRAALGKLAEFPLLDAIYGRRSRRFPVGGAIPAGPLAFTSRQPPQPLSDLERAIVLNTVAGWTGWHFGISHHPGYAPAWPNYNGSATGRTFGSAAGFHTSEFFFTDDSGTYFLPTRDAPPDRVYAEGEGAAEDQLNALLSRVIRLSDSRIHIPREEPYLEGHNTWIANHPGSLLVIPVADIAQQTLANIAFFTQNGFAIYDDIHDRPIPGIENYRDRLRFTDPMPLSFVEQYSLTEATAELMAAVHNGHLLLGALGLGGWTFDGIDRLTVLGASGRADIPGLGFRYDTDPRWAQPNPTGLPGIFEASCRPHHPSMAAAVDALAERKFGPGGPYHPATPGPFADNPGVRAAAAPWDRRFRELLSLQATYIDETFGKFPGTVPSVWIMNYLQAQHIDLDFYDTVATDTAYLSTHRDHQRIWHPTA